MFAPRKLPRRACLPTTLPLSSHRSYTRLPHTYDVARDDACRAVHRCAPPFQGIQYRVFKGINRAPIIFATAIAIKSNFDLINDTKYVRGGEGDVCSRPVSERLEQSRHCRAPIICLRWIFGQRSRLRFEVFHAQLYVRFLKVSVFTWLKRREFLATDFSIQPVIRLACDATASKGAECNFQLGRDELI